MADLITIRCEHCRTAPAEDDHACPYREDINNDSETLCDCCPACQHECAMDI